LSVDVDIADVDVAVVVTVTPVATGSPVDENGWPEGFLTTWRTRCLDSAARRRATSKSGFRSNDLSSAYEYLHVVPSSEAAGLIARWQSTKVTDIVLCSVVVYELRHGAGSSSEPFLTGDQSDAAGATGNIGYRPTTKCIAASVKTCSCTL
jgi:hypothetical protein